MKVVAALIEQNGKVLLTKRKTGDQNNIGKWEFPGGKVKDKETEKEAIEREIAEELEIKIRANNFIVNNVFNYPDKIIDLRLWRCEYIDGIIKLNDHNDYKWVDKKELLTYDLSKADINLAEYIINNLNYVDVFDSWSKRRSGTIVYDLWLDKYQDILLKSNHILDLGCGLGANTLYLKERGYDVLSCDFSNEALANITNLIKNSKTMYLDMTKTFTLEDNSYDLIIADLSLQYFDSVTTKKIMSEIKRILMPKGILLARVATVDDYNYGALIGEEIEKNYYFEGIYAKRFFDEEDIKQYFSPIGKLTYQKTVMTRDEDEYRKEKRLYEVKVEKGLN